MAGAGFAPGRALTVPVQTTGQGHAGPPAPPPSPSASHSGASSLWAGCPPVPSPRAFRELLQKASADRNSKDISGNRQVLAADQALERGKCPRTPSEGVRGEGEKVRRLLGTAFLHTPESRALFLPGAKSWQKRFRNVGRKTLVKGFGGRTRGGTGERRPRARGPRATAQRSRVAAGRGGARRLGCRRAPRGAKLHPGLARPRPGSPRLQAGDQHPGRRESPCPRAPVRPHWFPASPFAGLEGGTTRPGVKRLGGAEGAVAGRDRAPAAPCADPGESAPRREARALGYRERATPPPRLPLGPRRTPASPSPRLRGASGIVRFGVTPGNLSPRLGGRGASLNLAG